MNLKTNKNWIWIVHNLYIYVNEYGDGESLYICFYIFFIHLFPLASPLRIYFLLFSLGVGVEAISMFKIVV